MHVGASSVQKVQHWPAPPKKEGVVVLYTVPLDTKLLGRSLQFACRKWLMKFHVDVLDGSRPVRNDMREGEQTAMLQYALEKLVPARAKAWMLGVTIHDSP